MIESIYPLAIATVNDSDITPILFVLRPYHHAANNDRYQIEDRDD